MSLLQTVEFRMSSFLTLEYRLSSLQTFEFRISSLQTFEFWMSFFQTFEFRMSSLQTFEFRMSPLRKFDYRCHHSKHFNWECFISILFRKCAKLPAPTLYLVFTGLQSNHAIFVSVFSFSFSFTAWNSKSICIRFLDKKNGEGHENYRHYKICIVLQLFHGYIMYFS